eukprot:CAMPEP_0176341586 /NCGR_PEP_ID=MMETSP0126-20121128/2495_1 /TAXON_ID=141414 ORGANISM="Strombidinopsis acuminatum, Strain SPMC142" /NCGR_SAMPLE_ID=MMETSP0126 /ASSEMBLY_ACC=CAM_ASM_000229 /LENGTH=78 /DNA_ID=CAMNT_0017686489 /DNA_START=303 /DNA_END=539 /DNA_ORIENTATION=+
MKEAVCDGPITVAIYASGAFFSYGGGILSSYDCPDYDTIDHAVAVIGWKVINGIEVAVVRNSWGIGWGDEGNVYMELD